MDKKITAAAAAVLFAGILLLTGCGGKKNVSETSAASGAVSAVSEEAADPADSESIASVSDDETVTETPEPAEMPEEALEPEALSPEPVEEPESRGITIALDPGHQGPNVDMSAKEPNGPGSSEMKMKSTGGTSGRFTGLGEYELTLQIALQLRDALEDEGYDVVLTREDNDTAISNAERAQLANESGAAVYVRIHANGSDSSSMDGALALIPSASNRYVGGLHEESKRLAEDILDAYCEATGIRKISVQENDTMTGINWSEIPVMILEMGFMTNEGDDTKMADPEFQKTMVEGIVNGLNRYFE